MAKYRAWSLLAIFSFLALKALSQDLSLLDALDDSQPTPPPTPQPNPDPAGDDDDDFDLSKALGPAENPTTKAPVPVPTTKESVKPKPQPDLHEKDFFAPTVRPGLLPRTTTRAPRPTRRPSRPQPGGDELDLSDALDTNNDIGGKDKNGKGDGQFSDSDLAGVADDDAYNPDKGKGGRGGGSDSDDGGSDMTETGTIAGIVSAVAMALVGAVSSYITYQKKKLCFSIQQGLNAEAEKGENPEAVVSQEPQAQQTLLQPANAEPPNNENTL
ncbi:CD99 antigen-like protein 2 isoform X2 [Megalops cyprinoides]|uniref:CD99 antigen-like protein 2 isoform X2 n=1 Tax=Megalops cyprinoides TaxID=118141 RepID=UPI001864D0ED|nr:CD99 antigen-like protein 2 isoform X2 [Megalops cyprinoides]